MSAANRFVQTICHLIMQSSYQSRYQDIGDTM